ncbi:response regulator [Bradyrhizobium sp. A5]|uniref:response regulator n=1 Tax=Bradyrhizobium sp. A5 TaxID=3133696 RepID=UPI00324A93F4
MRTLAITAIANAFMRAFPASSLRADLFEQIALLCGAVLFVWLLSLTSGLDLSAGFF